MIYFCTISKVSRFVALKAINYFCLFKILPLFIQIQARRFYNLQPVQTNSSCHYFPQCFRTQTSFCQLLLILLLLLLLLQSFARIPRKSKDLIIPQDHHHIATLLSKILFHFCQVHWRFQTFLPHPQPVSNEAWLSSKLERR